MAEQSRSLLLGVLGTTGTGLVVGALAPVWLFTFGPNGSTQPIPRCSRENLCIVVAGLDNDVYWNPFSGGGANLMDFRDADTQRMVRWVRPIAQQVESGIEVKRYPREVKTPNPGSPLEEKQRLKLRHEIDAIFSNSGADIVVVGSVENPDQRYQIAFMRPGEDPPVDLPTYMVSGPQPPQDFDKALRAVLQDARTSRFSGRLKVNMKIGAPVEAPDTLPAPAPPAPTIVAPSPGAETAEPMPLAPDRSAPLQEPPPPVRESASPAVPVYHIDAVIKSPGRDLQPALDDLYARNSSTRTRPGTVTIECNVSVFGDLSQCTVIQAPPGCDRFARAFAGFAETRLRGEPARSNGVPEPGRARVSIQTRPGR